MLVMVGWWTMMMMMVVRWTRRITEGRLEVGSEERGGGGGGSVERMMWQCFGRGVMYVLTVTVTVVG